MPKDSTNLSKEEKKKLKSLAKEEKLKNKMLEKERKEKIKEVKRKSKESRKNEHSSTDVHKKDKKEDKKDRKKDKKKDKKKEKENENLETTENVTKNKMETKSTRSDVRSVQSAHKTEDAFRFKESRFVMPRGQKGFMFPVTPGPARYPVTRINYPIMNARRQVDLTKKMIAGPSPPAYTMGIRHSELREFYNKIQ